MNMLCAERFKPRRVLLEASTVLNFSNMQPYNTRQNKRNHKGATLVMVEDPTKFFNNLLRATKASRGPPKRFSDTNLTTK